MKEHAPIQDQGGIRKDPMPLPPAIDATDALPHRLYLPDLCDVMTESALKVTIGDHTTLQELLQSPLSALEASLLPPPAASTSAKVPVEPREVEHAYTQLMDRLRAWCLRSLPDHVATAEASLNSEADVDVAAHAVHTIAECLLRDLEPSLWDSEKLAYSPESVETMNTRLHLMSPNRSLSSSDFSSSASLPSASSHGRASLSAHHLHPGHAGSSSPLMSSPRFAHLNLYGPPSSSPTPHQQQHPPAQKQGKTELEIQRRRIQVDVAQAGIKCLAVILHHACYYSLLSEHQLDKLLTFALKIPHSSSLRLPKDRDIVAFSIWLFRAQALPALTVQPYIPDIISSLKSCFTSHRPNSEKPRRAVMEALSTVHFLALTYPDLFACRCINDEELRHAIMSCSVKDAFTIRARGCMALGGLFLAVHRPWPKCEEDDASSQTEANQTRETAEDLLSHYVCSFFQEEDHQHLKSLERLMDNAKHQPDQGKRIGFEDTSSADFR